MVDLDLNYGFKLPGVERAELQFNVTNLLDEEYFGNISSGTAHAAPSGDGFYSHRRDRAPSIGARSRFDF